MKNEEESQGHQDPGVWGRVSIVATFPSWTMVSNAGALFAERFSESSAPGSQCQLLGSETIGPLSAVTIIFKSPFGKDRLLRKKFTN